MKLTIVIPTYNGGDRVATLLRAFQNQETPGNSVEVLVVDNASTDGSPDRLSKNTAVADLQRRGWNFRVANEPSPGANLARLRGLREAAGDVVCFLDDDVEPGPRFFTRGLGLFVDPRLGGVVPRIRPRYEVAPPPAVLRRQNLLALNFEFLPNHEVDWKGDTFPFAPTVTAGFLVRRDALLAAVEARGPGRMMPGRIGTQLACGEDIELGVLLQRAGYTLRYSPALELEHKIPPGRFGTAYFMRLISGIVRSEATLTRIYRPEAPRDSRGLRLARFVGALLASPALLLRRDGVREVCFVLASRWASLAGPYPQLLARAAGGSSRIIGGL